ncbi:hypothetical protein D3C86_2169670 [compost metagenome]
MMVSLVFVAEVLKEVNTITKENNPVVKANFFMIVEFILLYFFTFFDSVSFRILL